MLVPILLALVTVVAIGLAVALRSARAQLEQRSERIDELTTEMTDLTTSRDQAIAQAVQADEARFAAEEAVAAANSVTESWKERSTAAEDAREQAEAERDRAVAESAEAAALAARLVDDGSADPAALWALERRRSERTWRHSVGVPGAPSPLAGSDLLRAALQIEVDAAREDAGAVVELAADLPEALSAGASLAVLRSAQELLADAVTLGEEVTLRVGHEGGDVLIGVDGVDAEGSALTPSRLDLPPSRLEAEPGVVRIRGVLSDR